MGFSSHAFCFASEIITDLANANAFLLMAWRAWPVYDDLTDYQPEGAPVSNDIPNPEPERGTGHAPFRESTGRLREPRLQHPRVPSMEQL